MTYLQKHWLNVVSFPFEIRSRVQNFKLFKNKLRTGKTIASVQRKWSMNLYPYFLLVLNSKMTFQSEKFWFSFDQGGHTTGTTLAYVFRQLGQSPSVLQKLQQEIDAVIGSKTSIEFDDLANLKYTSAIIKETLRLYPPVTQIIRYNTKPIKSGKYLIPKGSWVMVCRIASNIWLYKMDASIGFFYLFQVAKLRQCKESRIFSRPVEIHSGTFFGR